MAYWGFLRDQVAKPQGAALLVDIESDQVKGSSWYSAQDSRFRADIGSSEIIPMQSLSTKVDWTSLL